MAEQTSPEHTYTVAIVGSGFGGMAAARTLLEMGIDDFVIAERRDFAGGTWCQNTYPGAAVDVPSPLYSLSREPYPWSQFLADQPELEKYTNHILDKLDLRRRILLNTEVQRAEWDDDAWLITTNNGEVRAKYVINASGPLSQPVVPNFPGRETFEGRSFHTNAWDHSVDLRGKRVAVVGVGASAAQVIPAIVDDVAELHVFQRSPHWVKHRPDHTLSWLERRLLNTRPVYAAVRAAIYWNYETRIIGFKYSRKALDLLGERPARRHLEKQVKDPELRRKLTPNWTLGCKRVVVSNTYYPAIVNPKTTLHDRDDAVGRISPTGITTTQGSTAEVDVIIWGTGYDATDNVVPFPIIGRDGVKLTDQWAEYPRAYQGTTAPGFPNLFFIIGPNTGIGHTSALFIIEAQLEYIKRAINAVREAGKTRIEPTWQAEATWTNHIHSEMRKTVWEWGGCQSWYRGASGKVIAMFPGFSFTFRAIMKHFKAKDHLVA